MRKHRVARTSHAITGVFCRSTCSLSLTGLPHSHISALFSLHPSKPLESTLATICGSSTALLAYGFNRLVCSTDEVRLCDRCFLKQVTEQAQCIVLTHTRSPQVELRIHDHERVSICSTVAAMSFVPLCMSIYSVARESVYR